MRHVKPPLAVLCTFLLSVPAGGFAADQSAPDGPAGLPPAPLARRNFFGRLVQPYTPVIPAVPNMVNSDRLESLLRAGNLYLSLQDTIALALENNLDIQMQRYGPQIADTNLLRAQAGGYAAPASTAVVAGPASVTSAPPSAGLQSLLVAGSTQVGNLPPNLDPTVFGNAGWAHNTSPQSSAFVTGSNSLIQRQIATGVGVQNNFLSGTAINLGITNTNLDTNNLKAQFNPATNSALTLSVTQHLLAGFGPAVNSRQIGIARNNREISDLTFKAQVITTVAAISDLYWDLLSYSDNVRVQKDALAASRRLLEDDQKQVEVGTLAPIEVTRARAEIASGEQAVTVAETQLLQQETILKNALSKTGVASPEVAAAHVILTDHINVPATESITPIQDLSATALSARPEMAQFRILIENQGIAIRGTKNELLPTLDLVGALTNNGLAGDVNPLITGAQPSAFFIGGYGTVLSQIFARNFPTYSIGVNLSLPIHNRAAQADLINSELALRQQQVGIQRLENQVRVEVQNAVIGVQQARAQYQSATQQRVLQEETVAAERKKLDAGVSTTYNVILTERDLVTAESNEVAALSAYAKARVELERATGQTLNGNNISLDEAFKGKVSRPPAAIPPAPPAPLHPGQ
jgi:outer membrane protein